MKHLTRPVFNALPFYAPSLSRQQEIASILERLSNLIAINQQRLSKLDQLAKSRFIEMFGDIVCNERIWPIYKFSNITSSRLGKMLDKKHQTGKNSFPYLANFSVRWFHFDLSELNKMDFDEQDQQEFSLEPGDLLVCEGGEVGRCAVWRGEKSQCFFQKALHRVRCDKALVHPIYLAWWFKNSADKNAFENISGAKATIAHLPGIKLKQLNVPLPPIELQNEFAAFIEKLDKWGEDHPVLAGLISGISAIGTLWLVLFAARILAAYWGGTL